MRDFTKMTFNFSLPKRQFLHQKLDEIIRVWQRGSGKGSFILVINDGRPDFEFCTKLDFSETSPEQPQQHHRHQGHPRRNRGPARRARDRERAAKYQAAMAAKDTSTADPAKKFPGIGKPLGVAPAPTLPLPLQQGDAFPPMLNTSNFSPVCTTLPSTSTNNTVCTTLSSTSINNTVCTTLATNPITSSMVTSLPLLSQATSVVVPATDVHDVPDEHEDSDDEEPCGNCGKHFDQRSNPTGCGICLYVFHAKCKPGHRCVSFSLS